MLRISELPTYIALGITTLLKQAVETRKSKKWTYDTAVGHGDGNYAETYFSGCVILPKYGRDSCNSRIAKHTPVTIVILTRNMAALICPIISSMCKLSRNVKVRAQGSGQGLFDRPLMDV